MRGVEILGMRLLEVGEEAIVDLFSSFSSPTHIFLTYA